MTKEEMKNRMKYLARKFCKRNNVYLEFDSSVGKLVEKSYLSAYLLCLHESKHKMTELEKENAEAKDIIEDLITKIPASLVEHFESEKERAEKFLGWK